MKHNKRNNNLTVVDGVFTIEEYRNKLGRETGCQGDTVDRDDIAEISAYLYEFTDRFKKKESTAVNEWRLLLCTIFFGRLFANETNVYSVPRKKFAYQNESALTTLIFEELISKNELSGLDENTENLCIYKFGSVGYALILPELILMPFANYDKSAFRMSRFAQGESIYPEQGYRSVVEYFKENLHLLSFFLDFLSELREASVDRRTAFTAVDEYIEDLKKDFGIGAKLYLNSDCEDVSLSQALEHDFLYRLNKEYNKKEISDMLSSNLFKDNILCFFGVNAKMDNEGFVLADTALGRYRFDYGGQRLTPVSVRGFLGEDERKALYVLPPVSEFFFSNMIGGGIRFIDWSATVTSDNSCIDVKVSFSIDEMIFNEIKSFNIDNIIIARNLPYIAMWPHVPVQWNEYYVYSLHKNFNEDGTNITFPQIEKDERIKFVSAEDIEVSIPADSVKYDCHTVGILPEKFSILRSDSFPDAIELNVGGESLGYWMIEKDFKSKMAPEDKERKAKIGFDFATTASVIKLSIDKKIFSVDGPGEYLYDIFNPNYGTVRKTDMWETIHNYTMLGYVSDPISKIYTYGQNYNSYRGTELLKNTRHNVTGRAVFASSGYILHSIVGGDMSDNSMIYGNLKWPEDSDGSKTLGEKDEARDNFILSVLTWAVLKAKLLGCGEVEINVSYPQVRIGGSVLVSVNRIKEQLEQMSGFNNIKIFSCREAQANAAYLIEGYMNGYHTFDLPNPENGFMIVDIGGGTTDVAVCQYDNINVPFEKKVKGEISFKFAGREIIDIPLIMNKHVSKMWKPTTEIDVEEILRNFNWKYVVDTRKPLSDQISRMISAVGFILDNTELKNEYMINMTEESRQIIKYKYIGLFWLLGRYLSKLEEENKVNISNRGRFNIYLTGSASNGIYGLCMIDDQQFVAKCNRAACIGYSVGKEKIVDFITLAYDKDYGKKTNIKEAVATGLLFLNFTEEQRSEEIVSSYLDFFTQKEKEKERRAEFADFDGEGVISLLKSILKTLSLVKEETYSLDELDREDMKVIYECLNGKNEETGILYRNFIYEKIGQSPVSNDFMALYLLEIFLDLRRSLYPKAQEESITGNVFGEVNAIVSVKDEDMYSSLDVPVIFSFEVEHKIFYPDKFKIDYGKGVKTALHFAEIEEKYKEEINGYILDALKNYPSGITYSMLTEKSLDIIGYVKNRLDNSVFSDAGFINVGLKISVSDISEEDHARVLEQKQKFLAVLFNGICEKRKAECKSYGVINRRITEEFFLNIPLKENYADGEIVLYPHTWKFEIGYEIDDRDQYFSYRGIKFSEHYTDSPLEKTYVKDIEKSFVNIFESMWEQGVDESIFAVNYSDGNAPVQIDFTKIIPGEGVINEEIERIFTVNGFHLTLFSLSYDATVSNDLRNALVQNKESEVLKEVSDYLAEQKYTKESRIKAVEMLEVYPYFPECVRRIGAYRKDIAQADKWEAQYAYACKLAKSKFNRYKLIKAKNIFRKMLWYKESFNYSLECEEKISRLLRIETRIKKAVWIMLLIAMMTTVVWGVGIGIRKTVTYLKQSGENSSWDYSQKTKTLTIEGTGDVDRTIRNRAAFMMKKKKVERIVIGDGITSLYKGIFKNYENLKEISLPKTLEDIDENAFNNCDKLVSVEISGSVKIVGEYAFYDCNKLKTVSIPKSVKKIEDNAFASCKALKNVKMHKGSIDIAINAFESSPKVTFTSNAETEPNNYINDADAVSINKVYTGNLYGDYNQEADWYVLTVKKKIKKAALIIYTEKQKDKEIYWDISIRPYECRFYRPGSVWKKYIKGNTTMTVSDTFTLKEGTYYIEIESSESHSDAPYSFYMKDLS